MPPPIPSTAVFDNTFETGAGPLEAGTSFALAVAGLPVALVTCQHLFGPAGGLSLDVPPQMMSRFVPSASVRGALGRDNPVRARTAAAVVIPAANAEHPHSDVAAFPLEANAEVHPLKPAVARADESLYLAARLRQGAPEGQWLFAAKIAGEAGSQLTNVEFDMRGIHLPGTSGAPVIDERGDFVGMVVRFSVLDDGRTEATLLNASAIATMLREAEWPLPKKTGLWKRIFG